MSEIVFVCLACGKRSSDAYGTFPIDHGWDVACMLHAVPCIADGLVVKKERVVALLPGAIVDDKTEQDLRIGASA